MHINTLGLFSHLYRTLLNCSSICLGSWVGATTLCMEAGWRCTVDLSAWCSTNQLPGVNEMGIDLAHLLGAKMVHVWVYMAIYSHIYMHLPPYMSFKHMYTSYCIYWHVNLYLNASISADICLDRCILACILARPTSLLPLARRVAHDSKGAMQNCQMQE